MKDISARILKQAAGGDIEAFEEIYKAASSFVYNVAFKISRNYADAEEVTQDVFMKVYQGLKNFHFRSSFKTWVYRITVNTAINRYHKSMREEKERVDFDTVIDTVPASESAAEGAMQSDNEAMLNKLLEGLNPEYKACLLLREIEGLSYKEIAVSLRIPVNTVRSRIKRAREALLEVNVKGGKDAVQKNTGVT